MHLLITAGPTREPIDEVRFISNRSSGRVGVELARAAAERGHRVTLLLGPVLVAATLHELVTVERFTTTAELEAALAATMPDADALVMAAAVADYRLAEPLAGKAERSAGLELRLEPTPDLVAAVASAKRADQRVVAFALEEEAILEDRAVAKMQRKGVDAIVANPLQTMDADTITPVWLTATGERVAPGPMPKSVFAGWLVARVESLVGD